MDPRIAPLAETLRMNAQLFRNCLEGITDAKAAVRPSQDCNSSAYVAAHLVESRFYLLKTLGGERANPLERYTGSWKGIDEISDWPTLRQIDKAWSEVNDVLEERLQKITPKELDTAITTQLPLATKTTLGMLTFLVQHDSYHIGQLSLLRKYAGMPAMQYS